MLTPEERARRLKAFEAEIERRARKAYEAWSGSMFNPSRWEDMTGPRQAHWRDVARAMCDEPALVAEGMAHADLRIL